MAYSHTTQSSGSEAICDQPCVVLIVWCICVAAGVCCRRGSDLSMAWSCLCDDRALCSASLNPKGVAADGTGNASQDETKVYGIATIGYAQMCGENCSVAKCRQHVFDTREQTHAYTCINVHVCQWVHRCMQYQWLPRHTFGLPLAVCHFGDQKWFWSPAVGRSKQVDMATYVGRCSNLRYGDRFMTH